MTRRRIWPEVGRLFWITAVAAGLLIIICALSSLRWIGRPFPGFLLWDNLFVPAVGDTDWTGHSAGMPYQSRLIAINGRPVESAEEVYRFATRVPLGTAIAYTVESGGSAVTITVPTMRFIVAEYLWTMGNYVIVGALLTLLGFTVYRLRPDAPGARAMLIAGVIWGLYLVTSADIFGPGWFRPLCLVLQAVGPVALLQLALTFPVEREVVRRHPLLLPACYAVGAVIGILDDFAFHRWFAATLVIDRINSLTLVLGGFFLIGSLAYTFRHPPSPAARQRVKIVALGGFAAFLLPVAGYVLFYVSAVSFPLNFLTLTMVIFPVAIGYAIIMHDLFEVDAIIRRAIAWAILTALIAIIYLGGVGTAELLFTGRSGRVAQLVFLLLVVAAFNPLRNRVQAAVDFLFARDRYDYRQTVAEASRALAALLDLDTVVGRMLRIIADHLHVDFGAIWLSEDGTGYKLHGTARPTVSPPPDWLAAESPLVRVLERQPEHVLGEDELSDPGAEEGRELRHLGATLAVPMSFERRLVGFLALGRKESGSFYSTEDVELLRTLANQGAVAVTNARSYRALVRANEDLRAAQARLLEAERFAAIGELSAAVAHGIRNPVAGIKAAAQFASMELPPDHPLRENITDVIDEADKLEARIRDLLDFAKPFEPRLASCAVSEIIGDAVGSLRNQIRSQRIEVHTEIDPSLPLVRWDYAQIEQVLLVLFSNAIEAMRDGGKLTVSALTTTGGHIRLEVADTGSGISADQLPRLFRLFFTTKSSGTGLGLAVAKKIVERHGGAITVESVVGAGSRFRIDLPVDAEARTVGSQS